jgi:hypothetical protein
MFRRIVLATSLLFAWSLFGQELVNDCNSCIVVAQTVPHQTVLNWAASPTTTVTGYNVYKAPNSCTGIFTKLTATPVTGLTFTDSGMLDGAVNCYLVTAVSPSGESPQSMSQTVLVVTPTITASTVPAPPGKTTATSQ